MAPYITLSPAQSDTPASNIGREFAGAELGDSRLEKRLVSVAERLRAGPALPFPQALASDSDLEGFYRFLRNPKCKPEAILQPHERETALRVQNHPEVLVVHDSSDFRFNGSREGLGVLKKSGHGFVGHVSLAVTADESANPLGVLALESWSRTQTTTTRLLKSKKISFKESLTMPKEQERWFRGVQACETAVGGASSLIHVMDSEADDYKLMGNLVEHELRWIIRLGYEDRNIVTSLKGQKTKDVIAKRRVISKRAVLLSKHSKGPGDGLRKRNRARGQREATLAIRVGQVQFKRPHYLEEQPPTLTVNVVMVSEENPPKGEEPVDWVLLTTEPVDTENQVLKVVDMYRARWRIEEFFKALKTGCAFETRQLDSFATLRTALAILIPVAWSLLRLRSVAREKKAAPALTVLTQLQLDVLSRAAKEPLPKRLTAQAVLKAIAHLGGHLPSNGPPGWQVLGRGYQDLLMLVAGYRLASGEM